MANNSTDDLPPEEHARLEKILQGEIDEQQGKQSQSITTRK